MSDKRDDGGPACSCGHTMCNRLACSDCFPNGPGIDQPTLETFEAILKDAQEASVCITKNYGWLPAKVWHKLSRAKDALHLLVLFTHAAKAKMVADSFDSVYQEPDRGTD